MKVSMIGSVCESAGLGSPPATYTTNRNESMNNVAKAHADYRQSDWVQLVSNMYHTQKIHTTQDVTHTHYSTTGIAMHTHSSWSLSYHMMAHDDIQDARQNLFIKWGS